MIIFGPILGIFFLGIFSLIMDSLYPEKDSEDIILDNQLKRRESLSQIVAGYDNEFQYDWDKDSGY